MKRSHEDMTHTGYRSYDRRHLCIIRTGPKSKHPFPLVHVYMVHAYFRYRSMRYLKYVFTAFCSLLLLSSAFAGESQQPLPSKRGSSIFRKSSEDHASHYFMGLSAIGLARREGF